MPAGARARIRRIRYERLRALEEQGQELPPADEVDDAEVPSNEDGGDVSESCSSGDDSAALGPTRRSVKQRLGAR